MILTVIILSMVIGLSGFALARMQARLSAQSGDSAREQLTARINSLLPGIQCGQCGYPGCEPYAKALALGRTGIDRCPPGGEEVVTALARVLGQEETPAPSVLAHAQLQTSVNHDLAWVRAADCIGCTLCLDACPVDAIVGAPGFLHAVVPDRCTGCQLCVQPCPTDCIEMFKPEAHVREWEWPWANKNIEPPPPRLD